MKANDLINPKWIEDEQSGCKWLNEGLTVRDHIAIQAMQGIISIYDARDLQNQKDPEWIAMQSYRLADAMITESNKENSDG